jgi:NAD(P)-dependent dehydrogenase (short-subunit alcohol dehydrogenase family)
MQCTRKHALVTGASTGIGRATALRLAADGVHAFAAVRRDVDATGLAGADPSGLVTPVLLDVTSPPQIASAAAAIHEHSGRAGLDVLVNNAGIGVATAVELVAPGELRRQLEVNVVGQIAVTQALLPELRRARGTVVMIGSIGDRITMPFAGPLVASKRALAGLTDALRLELAPWSVRVVLIEPASIRTAAVDKLERDARAAVERMSVDQRELYGQAFERMVTMALARERGGSPPSVVAEVISRAVRSSRPRARYLVGRDSRRLALLARLPAGVRDRMLRKVTGLPRPGSLAPPPRTESPPALAGISRQKAASGSGPHGRDR